MSIIGNPVTLIGGASGIMTAFAAGRSSTNSWENSVGLFGGWEWADDENFNRLNTNSSNFECLKAGTYNIYYYIKSGYNASGNLINVTGRVYKNDSVISETVTSAATGNYGSITGVQLSAGDKIYYRLKNASGTSAQSGAIAICKDGVTPQPTHV